MACARGCDGGWLLDHESNTAAPCSCRPELIARAQEGAQRSLTKRKREQCRRAGRASGRRRKQLSKGRRTLQGHELALVWSVRQVKRTEFDGLYGRMCERVGMTDDARGRNTAYELYRVEVGAYRAQGQDFETTNGQRQVALCARGRPRGRRTVQRTRKRLEAMGLIAYSHVRRGQWRPGQRDSLRVHLLPRARSACERELMTPPLRERSAPPFGESRSACTALIPPAPPAENGPAPPGLPPPSGGNGPVTNEQEGGREARWAQMKLDAGWELTYRDRFALARQGAVAAQPPPPDSDGPRIAP